METTRKPTNPGEIIKQHYLEPLNLSIEALAENLAISAENLSEIVEGKRGIDIDIAMRLSRALATTPELWLNLQAKLDLWHARQEAEKWEKVKPLPNLQEILAS